MSVPDATPWGAVFAGAAALFSFLSVVVARLNYADDELRRQSRIENRILDKERRVDYERPPSTGSMGVGGFSNSVLEDTEPEFRFRVNEVLVSEKNGLRYLTNKAVHGFDGEVSVAIGVTRWNMVGGNWRSEVPTDFDKIDDFDFEGRDISCELYPEDCVAVVKSPYSDVDRVSDAVDDLLDFIDTNLGDTLVKWEG